MVQILLTEDEYAELQEAANYEREKIKGVLQSLCTHVCDHMPVKPSWSSDEPKPWQCILSVDGEHYCDECPVKKVCPHDGKRWSK